MTFTNLVSYSFVIVLSPGGNQVFYGDEIFRAYLSFNQVRGVAGFRFGVFRSTDPKHCVHLGTCGHRVVVSQQLMVFLEAETGHGSLLKTLRLLCFKNSSLFMYTHILRVHGDYSGSI